MILLTVGTQGPFDRLVRSVDDWLADKDIQVFGQIENTNYKPVHFESTAYLDPTEFAQRFHAASHIVAHAGMGTIIQALQHKKPLLIMPRKASLGEQRNEHQLATAARFAERTGIVVAEDEREIPAKMEMLLSVRVEHSIDACADQELIQFIREFISHG